MTYAIPQWEVSYRADDTPIIKDPDGRLVAIVPRGANVAQYIATLHNTGGDRDKALDTVMGSIQGKTMAGPRPRPLQEATLEVKGPERSQVYVMKGHADGSVTVSADGDVIQTVHRDTGKSYMTGMTLKLKVAHDL